MALIKDLSIILASATAVYGITSWRRETLGRRRIELSEDVLALFYQARDVIAFMRSPLGFKSEGSSRNSQAGESEKEKEIRDAAYVLIERYRNHNEVFTRLETLKHRFVAHFGRKSEQPFRELNQILHDMFFASRMLADMRYDSHIGFEHKDQRDRMRDFESMVWRGYSRNDPIEPRVEVVVKTVEEICAWSMRHQLYPATPYFEKARSVWKRLFSRTNEDSTSAGTED